MDAGDTSRRRNIPSPPEKTLLPAQGGSEPTLPSDTSPAVPPSVLYTLLAFTAAMVVIPIGSYFVTLHPIFRGNSTYAGAFAAVMANVVLIGYVVVAMREDQGDPTMTATRERRRSGGGRGVVEGKKAQ